jgi:hypothetical protein
MAPRNNTGRPKGAYPKVGGLGGYKFSRPDDSAMEKFQNFLVSEIETMETRKNRFESPSRLYAAARKLGIPESKVKKQIDREMAIQAKYAAPGEKKSEDLSMQDMIRRSKANAAAKKKAAVKKSRSYSPAPMTAAAKAKSGAAGAAAKKKSDARIAAKNTAAKLTKQGASRGVSKGKPIKPLIKKLKTK